MDDFIKETKHRQHQLEDIERKFLCTQLPTFLDYRQVFPFVADDLSSIEFRAPGVLLDYASVKYIEPETLQTLVGKTTLQPEVPMLVSAYIAHVNPPKGKEVLSFFLHGQRRKNLSDHVNLLTADENEHKRIHDAIQSFQVPPHMSMKDIVPSIGNMMRDLSIDKREEEPEPVAEKMAPIECHNDDSDEHEEDQVALHIPAATLFVEQDHWENPVLKQFKIDAGLSTRFSSEKTIKQVLVGTCAPHLIDLLELGKFQTEVPVSASLAAHTIDTFPISYIDHVSDASIAEICATPEAQTLYRALQVKPKDSREWVKTLILQYHPALGKFIQTTKNYKRGEQLNPAIVKKLL